MRKVNLSLQKDIKVVELDADKNYAIVFPDNISKDDFTYAVKKVKEIGLSNIVSVHMGSDIKFIETQLPPDEEVTVI